MGWNTNDRKNYALRFKVMDKLEDGQTITFTPDNVDGDDDFLNLDDYPSCTCIFHKSYVPYWVEFDNDEPMLLEDCPDSFYRSILRNIK